MVHGRRWPDIALQPTPGSGFSSASRFTFTDPAWLSLGREAEENGWKLT